MPVTRDTLGEWTTARDFVATPESIERYAGAVNDPHPAYRRGDAAVAPVLFCFVAAWDAIEACVRATLSDDLLLRMLHLVQDTRPHRLVRAGDRLRSAARVSGIVSDRRSTSVVVQTRTTDDGDAPVAEMYTTLYVIGHGSEQAHGQPPPETRTKRAGDPIGVATAVVAGDQARRYAEASGDHNPIHLDDDVARSAGQPGVILHGMCTMAMAAAAVVEHACGQDPACLARIAGRFSKPVFPGQEVATTVWPSEPDVVAFETSGPSGGVIRHGRAELRAGT